jgi:hypothetical protein
MVTAHHLGLQWQWLSTPCGVSPASPRQHCVPQAPSRSTWNSCQQGMRMRLSELRSQRVLKAGAGGVEGAMAAQVCPQSVSSALYPSPRRSSLVWSQEGKQDLNDCGGRHLLNTYYERTRAGHHRTLHHGPSRQGCYSPVLLMRPQGSERLSD